MPQESDLRAEEGIPVEVKLLENGGYYEAFLMEIFNTDALIHFPMNWMKETRLPLSLIRFPPDDYMAKVEVEENMVAEAYMHKEPGIYHGWFKCVTKILESEICQFAYLGGHSGVDFVSKDLLRPFNDKPSLSWDMLHVHVVSIPKEIQEYASTEGVHNFLKRAIKGVLIKYNPLFHVVSVISPNEDDILRAQILEKPYLQSLREKTSILRLIGNLDRKIKKAKNGGFVEEFTISDNFKGIAIRKEIANLRDAKTINGISNVEFDRKSYKYIVNGETEEALTEARELLEIRMEYYCIPKSEMSQMLKLYSENNELFFENTGVDEIFIPNSEDIPENYRREGFQPLAIVGNLRAINGAKFCIEVYRDLIYYRNLYKNKMKINQNNKNCFKKPFSISTDSRINLTVIISKVEPLTPESASHVEEYASSEVEDKSLVAETEANQQPDYQEVDSEKSYPLQSCSVTSKTAQMQNLHIEIPSSNSPSIASDDMLITHINAPSSNPLCSDSPSSNSTSRNLISFASGDMQLTEIEASSSNPPSNNASRFTSEDMQIPLINTSSTYLLSSNPLKLASGDIQNIQTEVAGTKATRERDPPKSELRLVELLQCIGYDGPMLTESVFEMAINIGLESPDYKQLIICLTEEIRKFKDISVRITPMTNPFNSKIFFAELEQFLRETHCPYSELLASDISLRLQTSSKRRLLIKFLAIEILSNRLLQYSAKLN